MEKIKMVSKHGIANKNNITVVLDYEITPELQKEGIANEFIRLIMEERKKNFELDDTVVIWWRTAYLIVELSLREYKDKILKETKSKSICGWFEPNPTIDLKADPHRASADFYISKIQNNC